MTTSRIVYPARPRASAAPPCATRGFYPALDGVRAIAFLMVFATHYFQLPWGWTGVNTFFVLSGFLITGILYDSREQPHRVRNFYVRRTLRIFPLYYGLILLLVLLNPVFHWEWNWHWLIWPAYLGNLARLVPPRGASFALLEFAQPLSRTFPGVRLSFGHFWSLCVEEQFYLVWPWVVFAVRGASGRRTLLRICCAAVLIVPVLRVVAGHTLPPSTIDAAVLITATPLPFDALLLGGLVALLLRGPWRAHTLPAARILFAALTAGCVLRLATLPAARSLADPYPYPSWTFTWGLSLIDLLSACVIVMALEPGSLTFRIFNLRPLRWLGRISYGAYVFHDILHPEFIRIAGRYGRLPVGALALASTLLLAWASFRWLESPFIRLKDRWTRSSDVTVRASPQTSAEAIHA